MIFKENSFWCAKNELGLIEKENISVALKLHSVITTIFHLHRYKVEDYKKYSFEPLFYIP